MIKSVGATHVLVGHSERRVVFGQSDEQFNKNLLKILETVSPSNLTPEPLNPELRNPHPLLEALLASLGGGGGLVALQVNGSRGDPLVGGPLSRRAP